jgi:hypothetical protein
MVDAVLREDFITVVSGLPRSGTSLMMQMLQAGGLPVLTDDRRPPDEANPRGYLEYEPVKRLRVDQSWLENAKGRGVKIIHFLLRELPVDGRFAYRVLFMKRPIEEVLASQQAMLERQGKKSADAEVLSKTYQDQVRQAEDWLAARSCFRSKPIDYHRVLANPLEVAKDVNAFLNGNLAVEAMAAAVDPNLCHQRAEGD